MPGPLNAAPSGSTLFQFSSQQLRDGIDPDLFPVHIYERSDLV